MKKRRFGRLAWLVVAGVATSAVVAAIAFAASNGSQAGGPPPNPTGAPAGQLKLGTTGTAFPVATYQFGAGAAISAGGAGSSSGKPSFSEFTFTKGVDSNSVLVLNKLTLGSHFDKVVLTATWGNGASMVYEMESVLVSGESQSSGGGQPSESFSLNYRKLTWTYTDSTGTTSGSYDLAAGA